MKYYTLTDLFFTFVVLLFSCTLITAAVGKAGSKMEVTQCADHMKKTRAGNLPVRRRS